MDIIKMMSDKEEMTEKTGPSTQDEEELVKKEDNSIEKDGEEEEGLLGSWKEVQGGGEDGEDGVNRVAKEDNAIETNGEELLEKQEEGGEHVEEVEQEVNEKGERSLSEEKAESPKIISVGNDNTETKPVLSKKQIEKAKRSEALTNVNNEVVKMRTEVKRVRSLIIRKLLRHLAVLKKKKGSETDLEKNKKRVDRLLEEIKQMKRLRPDQVTKKALQSEFNFEKVCKDITTTMAQRALARIATHPQFSKKIDVIKAAVKAFDTERKKEQQKHKMTPFQEEEERNALKQKEQETDDEEEMEDEEADDENETIGELSETAAPVNVTTETSDRIRSEFLPRSKTVAFTKSVKMASTKNTDIKDTLKETLQGKPTATKAPEKKQNLKPAPKMQQSKKDKEEDVEEKASEKKQNLKPAPKMQQSKKDKGEDEEDVEEKRSTDDKEDKGGDEEEDESDLESSVEEEKEYFDDSTEERFREQSEGSGESEDDFFVGKVSKFKKKKKKAPATPDQKSQTSDEIQTDKPQSELNYKASSVFCSLSSSKPGRGGLSRDRGRGRGGDRSRGARGRGGHRGGHLSGGPDRFSSGPKFEKQDGGARGKPEFKKSERGSGAKPFQSEDKDRTFTGRGTGRGRGGDSRQPDRRGPVGSSYQAPQQALHPSWEASKKRKEQQGQIMAFQGKKIKFDD